jgi:hypothetical protein
MKYKKSICVLALIIALLTIVATSYAIFSDHGPGEHEYTSIFGATVSIYGKPMPLTPFFPCTIPCS